MKTKLKPGWQMMQLNEVGKIVTGNTPPRIKPENYGNDIVWIKPPNLDKKKYVDDCCEGRESRRVVTELIRMLIQSTRENEPAPNSGNHDACRKRRRS